ncbi:hypothetical protein Bca4012_019771 [Brassica carinata]
MTEASPVFDIHVSQILSDASPAVVVPPTGASVPVSSTEVSPPSEAFVPVSVPVDNTSGPGSEFNWLSRAKDTKKFSKSSIHVPQSEAGIPRIKIPYAVFERGAKAHSDYIVGIFYGNAPSYGKIWRVLNYLWGKDRRVTIHNLSKNAYLFYTPSVALRQRILQHELWKVGDSPFFVTEWKASFIIDPPSLQRAPLWATLSKVTFDLVTDEGQEIISKPLGKIVDVKPFSSVSSMDVKVIVNLTVRLPDIVEIERENDLVDVIELQHKEQDQTGSKKNARPQKDSKKAKDNPKVWAASKQIVKEPVAQDQTVPLNLCCAVDNSIPSGSIPDLPVPGSDIAQEEAPFLPAVKAVTLKFASGGVQENVDVHKEDQSFAQHKEDSNLSLVVTTPMNGQSSSPQYLSKTAKNKKRKLAKRSPVSGCINDFSKHRPLCSWINKRRICFGALLETHVSEANSMYILSVLGPEWKLIANYQFSDLGKVWIIYKDSIRVQFLFADYQSISVKILPPEALPFYYTSVYASNELDERRQLWVSLKDTAIAFDLASHLWMVVCWDFNEILDPREWTAFHLVESSRI